MTADVMRPRVKLTYEEYLGFPDDGKRHELIDGEHYVSPSPIDRHQRALARIHLALGPFVRDRGLGEVFFAPFDVILSETDVVEPDLLFISTARLSILSGGYVHGAPDLLVEILSPSSIRYDAVTKLRLYEKFGVGEYWLVDPEREQIEVFRLADGRLKKVAEHTRESGEALTSPLFPGLRVDLGEIFG
jgi:Uma2 family endonuclease